MVNKRYSSWGNVHRSYPFTSEPQSANTTTIPARTYLAYGNGRSYGDTCLAADDTIIDTRRMNAILEFDPSAGILRAEAGITLSEIIDALSESGWFLPVTPGTSAVTLAGAVANDVHGKNHHNAGSFGRHVRRFELLRSAGTRQICSPNENSQLFSATIGGMGLTGLITWIEISLMSVPSRDVDLTVTRFSSLNAYFDREENAQNTFTYSVAWLDGLADGANFGRGLLLQGNHSIKSPAMKRKKTRLTVPAALPFNFVRNPALRLMNNLYYHQKQETRLVSCDKFFYPLDSINGWNRLYGRDGFRQFQCVVPEAMARDAIPALLKIALKQTGGSGLAVLKKFGRLPSPGILSFPMPGYTLTLDFPNRQHITASMLADLHAMTIDAGGRVNPYKDSTITHEVFTSSYPHWRKIIPYLDPLAESRFSRRIGLTSAPAGTPIEQMTPANSF